MDGRRGDENIEFVLDSKSEDTPLLLQLPQILHGEFSLYHERRLTYMMGL